MSEYPWNKKNITFTWLSSLYNPFKKLFCFSETIARQVKSSYFQHCQGAAREPKITLACLIKSGIRNLLTLILNLIPPSGLFFCGWRWTLLLCRANLEYKEICASDWLKPFTSTLEVILSILSFILPIMNYIPDLALHYKKPIYSSSIGSVKKH